jgi:hypothetical protein
LYIIGQNRFNSVPERLGMVHFLSVAQFMNDYIIEYPGRGQHKTPVKV